MTTPEPYATAWGHNYTLVELDAMTHWQIQRVFFLMRTYNIYMRITCRWYRFKLGFYQGLLEFIVGIRILFDI
jgi:hypothetical protein